MRKDDSVVLYTDGVRGFHGGETTTCTGQMCGMLKQSKTAPRRLVHEALALGVHTRIGETGFGIA